PGADRRGPPDPRRRSPDRQIQARLPGRVRGLGDALPERAYLSIGEVLSLLKEEFSDITISKIRFLESQGLIDPERTPSGYRRFSAADVERLRFILREQREHFLPLKVIKERLEEVDGGASLESVSGAAPDSGP